LFEASLQSHPQKKFFFYLVQTSATTNKKTLGSLVFAGFALKMDKRGAVLEKNTTCTNAVKKMHIHPEAAMSQIDKS
jgi:hypothetical protein